MPRLSRGRDPYRIDFRDDGGRLLYPQRVHRRLHELSTRSLDLSSDWVIHREAYTALLRSLIPSGQHAELARRLAITVQRISSLKQPDNRDFGSEELIDRLTAELEAGGAARRALQYHRQRAHELRQGVIAEDAATYIVDPSDLDEAFDQAVFTPGAEGAADRYQLAQMKAEVALSRLDIRRQPVEYAHAAVPLIHAHFIGGRPSNGLVTALRVWSRLEEHFADDPALLRDPERIRTMVVAVRDVALAYNNLRDPHAALDWYELAARFIDTHATGELHRQMRSDIDRNRLIASSRLPRVPVDEVQVLAEETLERFDALGQPLNRALTLEHHARVLLQHARVRDDAGAVTIDRAAESLGSAQDLIERVPDAGPDHVAAILSTNVELLDLGGNRELWWEGLVRALEWSAEAGLAHRYRLLLRQYQSRREIAVIERLLH